MATEFVGRKEFVDDYAYWVTRDGKGETQGWRQLLKNGELDPAMPPEIVLGNQLPKPGLRRQYDLLVYGGIPSEVFR